MKKILFIFGTRPEAIKLAPIIKAMQKEKNFSTKICITAQHRSMLDEVLNLFSIIPDYDLNIMQDSQDLFSISIAVLSKLKEVLEDCKPNLVLVHGDTSTTFIASLSAFYLKIKIAHIEAGLRTYDRFNPFPEEINRQFTSKLSNYHFAPSKAAYLNLINEGISKKDIFVVGNSVIDSFKLMEEKIKNSKNLEKEIRKIINLECLESKFILVTVHRRESFGVEIENIAYALRQIALKRKDIQIIYPLHLNPNIQIPMRKILSEINNIHLIKPLNYSCFVYLMLKSYLILTDSGGIQEEATIASKPTLILRNITERNEAQSILKLIGTKKENIIEETLRLIDNEAYYKSMLENNNYPYGSGDTSRKIINHLKNLDF